MSARFIHTHATPDIVGCQVCAAIERLRGSPIAELAAADASPVMRAIVDSIMVGRDPSPIADVMEHLTDIESCIHEPSEPIVDDGHIVVVCKLCSKVLSADAVQETTSDR